jgi:CheY-like chemotaxis protein
MNTQRSSHTSSSNNSGSRRILIVEDTDTTRRRLAAILGSHGYFVEEAVDGQDALHKASMTRFDAIVLDLVLPHVNGWQFRETALRHAELRAIPTIILTVQPLREPDRYALRTPFVLRKPFEDATVLAMVEQACAVHSAPVATPVRCRQPLTVSFGHDAARS